MSHDGVGLRAVMRSVAFLTAGVLAVPALAACSAEDQAGKPRRRPGHRARGPRPDRRRRHPALGRGRRTGDAQHLPGRRRRRDRPGSPAPCCPRCTGSTRTGRPQRNPDYLESAKVVDREPKQVVLYKLNQQAVWSDGREIGAADFAAQWRALSGKDTAYWTARNAGYDRIEKIERGANDLEVKVTFSQPVRRLEVAVLAAVPEGRHGHPGRLQRRRPPQAEGHRGPLRAARRSTTRTARSRSPATRAGGAAPPSSPRSSCAPSRATSAPPHSPPARSTWPRSTPPRPTGSPSPPATRAARARSPTAPAPRSRPPSRCAPGPSRTAPTRRPRTRRSAPARSGARPSRSTPTEQSALRGFVVRKSLEPAYTQLALNGSEGPLADERVRRAVARALDREELAEVVLKPLGLPAEPVGSHLALSGQQAYADNSGALGGQDTKEAQALLADAGWVPGGPGRRKQKPRRRRRPGPRARTADVRGRGSGDGSARGRRRRDVHRRRGQQARRGRPGEPKKDPKDHSRTQPRAVRGRAGRQAPRRQAVRGQTQGGRAGRRARARTPPRARPPRRAPRPARSPRTASR